MKTCQQIAHAVRSGAVSAVEVATSTLRLIRQRDTAVNAFTEVFEARAMLDASRVDAIVQSGRDPGPLAGVPFAVKNLFDVAGVITLAGSSINRDHPPALEDATAVRRLCDAGGVLVGALNMDEYAYGFTTENSHYGPTRNPHDLSRIAGGSSGGSGAAIAGAMVPLTLGSDTSGSIRVPASLCGVFGLKPTYGRVSRAGSFPFVYSFDHVGPLAATTLDLALAYDAMTGPDVRDPVSMESPASQAVPTLDLGMGQLRIGVAEGYFVQPLSPEAKGAISLAGEALGTTRRVTLPEAHRARAAAYVLTASEGSALHLPQLRSRIAEFEPLTRDRLLAGAMVPAVWVHRAQRFRRWFQQRILELFDQFDVILAPATPSVATPIGAETMIVDGQTLLVRPNMGLFTQPISFIGLPVVAAPIASNNSLPVGIQIIAAPGREDLCLRVSAELERRGIARAWING